MEDMEELKREEIINTLDLSKRFKHQSMLLESKPKYQTTNIIEYLGALETHISHIFAEILKYNVYDVELAKLRYPVLESFVQKFFKGHDINIDSPVINAEVGNIDILIKDKQYVIIIENKINNAKYQDFQPAKYVQKHQRKGTKVFVVLLPKYMKQGEKAEKAYIDAMPKWCPAEGKGPIKYSCPGSLLAGDFDCYVRALHKNFAEWLSDVAETIPKKENYLYSNIIILTEYLNKQYCIHYNLKYEMDKIELLKDILGFKDKTTDLDSLVERKDQVDELFEDVKSLHDEINKLFTCTVKDFMDDWYKEITNLVEQEKDRVGDSVAWCWPNGNNTLCFAIQILVYPGTITVNVKYYSVTHKIMIFIYYDKKDPNLTQDSVDKVNDVLTSLGMHKMNLRTQCSEIKSYPFSEAREQIRNLLALLFNLRRTKC